MDSIDPLKASFLGSSFKNKKQVKKKETKKIKFANILKNSESKEAEMSGVLDLNSFDGLDLEKLIDDIHLIGEKLKENPVFSVINEYKNAVRNFIGCIVDQTYETEDRISGINILKRKKFTIIKKIDSQLEGLASGILQNQMTQLDILAKVDEIRGLLVDLLG